MKSRLNEFGLFGGTPEFNEPLHVAQVNLPPWTAVETVFRGIFEREYYANHGPLSRELDRRFAEFVGAKYAVSVTNGTMALMILTKALNLTGEVIVPAFTFPATVQALTWAGVIPVLCDVDLPSHVLTPETVAPCVTSRTTGIVGVHLWGRSCCSDELLAFAEKRDLVVFFDACHAAGCSWKGRQVGTLGAAEAFSFHATKVINAGEGGCITTNDDELAARLRTIRSFHPTETFADVSIRTNGKISEAQAAMALLSLDQFSDNVAANRDRYCKFRQNIDAIPGVMVVDMEVEDSVNNFQYVVLEIDREKAGMRRDVLVEVLKHENVICRRHFRPGLHKRFPELLRFTSNRHFDSTETLADTLLQLPNSQSMTLEHVDRICSVIEDAVRFSKEISKRVKGTT